MGSDKPQNMYGLYLEGLLNNLIHKYMYDVLADFWKHRTNWENKVEHFQKTELLVVRKHKLLKEQCH